MLFRTIIKLLAVVLFWPSMVHANDWPSRPIEWVVPFAAGGSTDVLARLVADKLKDRLGQPITIVNRSGAQADIGYRAAASAKPDGYTIVLTVPSLMTNPFQLKSAIDPNRLMPIIYLADGPYVLLASEKFKAPTVEDAVAAIRAKPNGVSCAMTGGMGSLSCQTLQSYAKATLLQVPYRGVEPATLAVIAGEIDLLFSFGISAERPLETMRVRALATTASKRGSQPFPNLPTISEVLPGFEVLGWSGVGARGNATRDHRSSEQGDERGAQNA